ncbi:MAG: mandelate racemase/muconate lactonizing enzyme family protein [Alphaproteobacteria bacterium]
MSQITHVELKMLKLAPKVRRSDAIQSFVNQETPMVTIRDSDGAFGTGYSYTIGTGGPSIMALLKHTLAPALIGRDPNRIEHIWRDLLFSTHATTVGAITSLALAAIDTALWDLRCRKQNLPLWKAAGGAREKVPLYSTEGGWLHLETQELIDDALKMQQQGFHGSKIKIGREYINDDAKRIHALRKALGAKYEIFADANQGFTLSEASRAARILEEYNVAWFEEPLPADDVTGHATLARQTFVPIAVGESLYALSQFKDYLQTGAASIVQVDAARIGGITPWLKVAHLAEAFNVSVCPHFLMELHLPLACATTNAKWLEYIPQLDSITTQQITIQNGYATPSNEPGLGIQWDQKAINAASLVSHTIKGET